MTILSRLQSAIGPDHDLDAEIAVKVGWVKHASHWYSPADVVDARNRKRGFLHYPRYDHSPAFTGSLDIAVTLGGGRGYWVGTCKGGPALAGFEPKGSEEVGWNEGATAILALCIAWAAENGV